MRLLHFADLHIGMTNYSRLDPETGLETRLGDFFKTFDEIVDYAISEKVDAVLFAGDMYKTRDPSPTQQRGVGERIKRLTKSGIPLVLVVGNHDTPNTDGKANTLDIYSTLEVDQVTVIRTPQLINLPTKSGNLQIIGLPWLQKGDLKLLGDKMVGLYERLKDQQAGGPAVIIGHLEVAGAMFGSEKGLVLGSDITIPLSLLTDHRLNYVALGHIHKYQELSKNPPVVYSGSPERIDFGEEKEEKGFVIVEIGKASSYKFVPTNARKFCTITIKLKDDDQNPTQTVLDEITRSSVKDKIVRVLINIPADLQKEIEIDKIKRSLADANYIASISRNVERKERTKIDSNEEVERLTPLEALAIYFKSKNLSSDKVKELTRYAQGLLGS